jgi:thiosulfate/3-mercaptopyruvate sulfurtransferase
MRPDTFANPGALATAGWLEERLDDPAVRIVDARYMIEMDDQGRFREVPGRESFVESHIAGAVFLDLNDLRDRTKPAHIVDAAAFSNIMSRLGIGSDHEVIVYDTDGGVWAARLWWALRLYGHSAVRILDGGFSNWVKEGLRLETGEHSIETSRFLARGRPDLIVAIGDVVSAMSDSETVIIDGLTEPFHTGAVRLFPHLQAGHIPGAVNIPAPDNLDSETDRLLPVAELAERWRPVVDSAERIITYCGAGMYGAFDLFVLHLLGYDAALYDGSWEEWAANKNLPIATTPPVSEDEPR